MAKIMNQKYKKMLFYQMQAWTAKVNQIKKIVKNKAKIR